MGRTRIWGGGTAEAAGQIRVRPVGRGEQLSLAEAFRTKERRQDRHSSLCVGPTALVFVDEHSCGYYGSSSEPPFCLAILVEGFIRHTLFRERTVSPYVRAGMRYPIARGEKLGDSEVGAFGAVGVEFLRTKSAGVSVAAGYGALKISVKYPGHGWSDKVTFPGFNAGISVVFEKKAI